MKKLKVIVSGGGTGGHIFPAVAIANALKQLNPETEILFVGAKGRMEMEKVPKAGYKIIGLWISGLQRKLTLKNLSFPFKVISSLMKAHRIISEFKPHLVIGTGGYASGPMLRAASTRKIKTLIQEQNSFPGITNRILSKNVDKICTAYEGMEKFFPASKIVLTGNPIRTELLETQAKDDSAFDFFNLDKGKPTVLVIGGSLGARTINESIAVACEELNKQNIQVLWQTGKSYINIANETIRSKALNNVQAHDFIYNMGYAYSVADVVVSRAGAISISELCSLKKPSILVPSPNVAEDHQTKNAMALVKEDAAIMIKDSEAKQRLGKVLLELLQNKEEQTVLANNIAKLSHTDAAKNIANIGLELVNG